MAATAFFAKQSEDETTVSYRFGSEPDDLSATLVIDKATGYEASDQAPGMTDRMALSKILRRFDETGHWPESGASMV